VYCAALRLGQDKLEAAGLLISDGPSLALGVLERFRDGEGEYGDAKLLRTLIRNPTPGNASVAFYTLTALVRDAFLARKDALRLRDDPRHSLGVRGLDVGDDLALLADAVEGNVVRVTRESCAWAENALEPYFQAAEKHFLDGRTYHRPYQARRTADPSILPVTALP